MTDDELSAARRRKAREIYADMNDAKGLECWRDNVLRGEFDGDTTACIERALELCDWHPPVDPDLLIAREAAAQEWERYSENGVAAEVREGKRDYCTYVTAGLAAIKLYKSRTGA